MVSTISNRPRRSGAAVPQIERGNQRGGAGKVNGDETSGPDPATGGGEQKGDENAG